MATSHEPQVVRSRASADARQLPPLGVELVKPRLRGWLHAAITPLAVAAGIVLICLSPTTAGKVGGGVFLAAAVLLFGTSALFHRFSWGVVSFGILRRLDHSNIYIFIAASYTPFALLLLDRRSSTVLLLVIWSAAVLGLLFRTFWLSAPRWLYTALYVVTGCAAIGWLPQFGSAGGPAVLTLILIGGGLYVAGALVYALRRPDPWPRWFGFHEVFHSCTIGAFISHYIAISLVSYSAT
ncbi:hemolysin III family protein [Microlunatus elymi]|uniref:Hemolysin III family protein n=1 Tax=Microlunatus elymi TaxID=2596828 RepID=A0A516Q3A1_9ACTN|nr:hemolysin III family protein [Microlunatus elymi]QDP97888.1 hemolysin III family protein [Microlunatus elymi]